MPEANLIDKLKRLREVILEERECAKALDMNGLQRIIGEKSGLMGTLEGLTQEQLTPEVAVLAGEIRRENRRNAYLFWSSLNWVRDTIQFYNGQLGQKSYGHGGHTITRGQGGSLLSGKI